MQLAVDTDKMLGPVCDATFSRDIVDLARSWLAFDAHEILCADEI